MINSLSENIQLENERLRLEELSDVHFQDLLEVALQYPDLLKYSPTEFGTETALRSIINQAKTDRENNQRIAFAIFDKTVDKYVGSTSFGSISLTDARIEIGWTWISKNHQGTGLNRQCKKLMLAYAFEELLIERVELKTDLRNQQSQRAMEKIGAKREGVLRSHTLMLDGYRRDTVYFSILKDEWQTVKSEL